MALSSTIASDIRGKLDRHSSLKDRVSLLLSLASYRRVTDPLVLHEVQAMRYRSYLREGAVAERADRLLADRYDTVPNGVTYALLFAGQLCASIRLHFSYHDIRDTPANEAFRAALTPLLEAGRRVVEANCFCVDPMLAGRVPEFAYLALRLPYIAAGLRAKTTAVATVRAEHRAFYKRVLRCDEAAPPRHYPGRIKALALTLVDFDAERDAIARRNPFFAPLPGEIEALGLLEVDQRARGIVVPAAPALKVA